MPAIVTNNAESTLTSSISPGATSFTLNDGSDFPSPSESQYFFVRLGTNDTNEVVKVTARAGNVCTCEAAASGWSGGTPVKLTFSQELYDDIRAGIDAFRYVDDIADLQAALDAVDAVGGGTVRVGPGTYNIVAPLTIYSNTHLVLDRAANMVRAANIDHLLINNADGVTGGYGAASNITVEGGVWDGAKGTIDTACGLVVFGHASEVTIRGVTFRNLYDWHMIELNAVRNGRVLNCNFFDYGTATVGTEALQLDLMKGSAQFPLFGPYDDTPCEDILISGCTFRGGVRGIGSHSSTTGVTHKRVRIVDNHFENLRGEAIQALNYEDLVVLGNQFYDVWRGIYVFNEAATECRRFLIANNSFKDLDITDESRAIYISGTSAGAALVDGVIKGNAIHNCLRHAIGIEYSDHWVVCDNTLNTVERVGIWIWEAKKILVKSNLIHNTGIYYSPKRSIYIGNSTAGPATNTQDCAVIDNICEGIYAGYADRTLITLNNASAHITKTGNDTNTQKLNNFVAGAWAAT